MRNVIVIFALFLCAIIFAGCTKCGCTDPDAINYRRAAQEDDGSCMYSNSKIVGKYICTRKSELENTTDENIVLEIFPVRTSKKLLRAWDSSLNLTFLMTYDKKGNLRDTALAQGLPGYTQLATGYGGRIDSYETSAYGTYDKSESILLNYNYYKCISYRYTPEHFVYTGTRIQEYPVTFDTPDYRNQWTGIYEGTKRVSFWSGPAGMEQVTENTTNVTLEVSLTDNDSVVRIEEIIDDPEAMFYYVKTDGTLKRISTNVGSFSNDSLIIEIGQTYSPGASGSTYYKCKKR